MAGYLGMRILGGHLDYVIVVGIYGQFKDDIDEYLRKNKGEHLIVEI